MVVVCHHSNYPFLNFLNHCTTIELSSIIIDNHYESATNVFHVTNEPVTNATQPVSATGSFFKSDGLFCQPTNESRSVYVHVSAYTGDQFIKVELKLSSLKIHEKLLWKRADDFAYAIV